MRIRTADALALFGNDTVKLRSVFPTELRGGRVCRVTRQAMYQWGEFLPPLRARQLIEACPDAAAYVVGEDGLTAVERALLAAQSGNPDQGTRAQGAEEDSHG